MDVKDKDPVFSEDPGEGEVPDEILVDNKELATVVVGGLKIPVYEDCTELETEQTLVSQHGSVLDVVGWRTPE